MNTARIWISVFVVCTVLWNPGNFTQASIQNQALPSVPFVKNEGQLNANVAYYSKLFSGDVYVMEDGRIVYSLPGKILRQDDQGHVARSIFITEELLEGRAVKPVPGVSSPTRISYLHGRNLKNWKINIPTYSSILMPKVWDKIDLELIAYQQNIEKRFTLQPGANIGDIRLKLSGTSKLEIDQDGALEANTALGTVAFTPPIAWQIIKGKKQSVEIHYLLDTEHATTYGFIVGKHNTELALYIDPLLQSTFLGGSGVDGGKVIAVAENGDVYVSGSTWISTGTNDFPGIAGGADEVSLSDEVFVARLSGDLKTLYQVTYIGGSQSDRVNDIALAENGDVIIVGETHSSDFPGVTGGLDEILNGTWDGFVVRLNSSLSSIVQSTYLGGSNDDHAWEIMVEPSGHLIIAGESNSADFPGLAGGAYTTPENRDIFLSRLSSDLTTISQSTFYGGSSSERPYGLEVGSNDDFYIAGYTSSPDLKDISGGAYTSYAGYNDGFIVQISSDLKTVKQATYLGGPVVPGGKSSETIIRALVIGVNGDIYVGGGTNSDQIPGVNGGAIASYKIGYISQLTADLTAFIQSTYIGGTDNGGEVFGLAFHNGDLLAIGASGNGVGFPAINGGDDTNASGDAYLVKLALDLKSIKQSTFIGGNDGNESIEDIYVRSNGTIYVTGSTTSADFRKTEGGADVILGGSEAFVAMFDSLAGVNIVTDDECTFFVIKAKNTSSAIICL